MAVKLVEPFLIKNGVNMSQKYITKMDVFIGVYNIGELLARSGYHISVE